MMHSGSNQTENNQTQAAADGQTDNRISRTHGAIPARPSGLRLGSRLGTTARLPDLNPSPAAPAVRVLAWPGNRSDAASHRTSIRPGQSKASTRMSGPTAFERRRQNILAGTRHVGLSGTVMASPKTARRADF
jgi:hypothetical protein